MALNQSFNQDTAGNIGTAATATTSAPTYSTGTVNPLSLDLNGNLRVNGSGVTQPISASALPLPAGASTSALQTSGNTTLSNIQANQTNGTQVTTISGTVPLPTGAATAANQVTQEGTLTTISGQLPAALGQTTAANSLSVVLASNQPAVPVTIDVSSTGTITSVALSTSTTVLLAANSNRKGFIIYNDSMNQLFVAFAATASTTAFSTKIQAGGEYEPGIDYTGVISGIASAATGSARITEFT